VRLPRHRIWPILPGVRSFLNLAGISYLAGPSRQPGSLLDAAIGLLTIARSGMKRSPRTNTRRDAIAKDRESDCVLHEAGTGIIALL